MIFSSGTFIFAFLPVVLLVSVFARRLSRGPVAMLLWLTMASLFFYGFWKADYLPLILLSISVNWVIGRWVAENPCSSLLRCRAAKVRRPVWLPGRVSVGTTMAGDPDGNWLSADGPTRASASRNRRAVSAGTASPVSLRGCATAA